MWRRPKSLNECCWMRALGHTIGVVLRLHLMRLAALGMAQAELLRLDYISCLLTIVSTILIGKRLWYGWIVAGVNSLIICVIGIHTGQFGFIPANLFCLALYAWNLRSWTRA